MRSGTLDTPAIRGFAVAVDRSVAAPWRPRRARLGGAARRLLVERDGARPRRHRLGRLARAATARAACPATRTCWSPAATATRCSTCWTPRGVECSTGSACQAGVPQPSHVLLAMGVPESDARGALRVTLGPHLHRRRRRRVLGRAARRRSTGPGAPGWPRRRGRGADAGRRRDERRGRLGGRRRPDARRRARGGRGPPRAEPERRDPARVRPRLLHDRGRRRRPPGRRHAGHPVLRVGHGRPVQARTSIEDFVAEYAAGRTPNPCLRCNEKIKFAALLDKARGPRLRRGRHRPLRPGRRAPGRAPRAAPGGRHGQGPVLRPRRARRATSSRGRSSRSATPPSRRSARRPRERGFYVAAKPDSHDICFIADGDTRGWLTRAARRAARRHRRHATARSSASTAGAYALHRRSAQGPAPRTGPPPTASRATSSRCGPRPTPSSSAPPTCSASTPSPATTPAGAARRPQGVVRRRRPGARARRGGPRARPGPTATRVEVRLERPHPRRGPGQSVVLYDGTRVVGLGHDQRRRDQPLSRAPRPRRPTALPLHRTHGSARIRTPGARIRALRCVRSVTAIAVRAGCL